jgi:hypothetical protein
MFKKFGQGLPESLVDIVSGMMEAKSDEPAAPDAEAIARRKRLQALKDKQEDDAAETSYKKDTSVRKVAGSAYGGAKQKDDDVNEALKGNQHKIDANKNGKVDAHDFKLLRAKKKVDEDSHEKDDPKLVKDRKTGKMYNPKKEFDKLMSDPKTVDQMKRMAKEDVEEVSERELSSAESDKKEKYVKSMKKGLSGFKSRYGKDAKSVMYATATKLAKENVEELDEISKNLAKRYYRKASNQAMDSIVAKDNPLAFSSTKKDNEKTLNKRITGMKAAGRRLDNRVPTSESVEEYDELVLDLREGSDNQKDKHDDVPFDPDPPKTGKSAVAGKYGYGVSLVRHLARQGIKKAMKKETMMGKAGTTSEETEIEESRGHKILATKLRQIDTMSSGIAPDHSINVQSAKDKIKDVSNTDKVEIVTQKDCTLSHPGTDVSHMDDKYELNKKKHGYGNVVHNEEVEELDEVSADLLGRYSDKASKEYNDPKTPERKKSTRRAGLMLGYNKVKARANVPATYKEEAEQVDEVSKSQLQRYSTSKEVIKSSKYDKHFSDKQAKQSAHRDSKDKSGKSVFGMKEEIKLDETAALDQYIKSMGYDPLNMDKNKKVMFAKTNAFKNWAATRQEDLYDGGQKGTQDIDSHMSPGATARG